MNAKQLIELLETLDPDTEVYVRSEDLGDGSHPTIRHIAITAIDGKDKAVIMANFSAKADGTLTTDCDTQVVRVNLQTAGKSGAQLHAELQEEFNCKPALELPLYLEAARVRQQFKKLDDLMKG